MNQCNRMGWRGSWNCANGRIGFLYSLVLEILLCSGLTPTWWKKEISGVACDVRCEWTGIYHGCLSTCCWKRHHKYCFRDGKVSYGAFEADVNPKFRTASCCDRFLHDQIHYGLSLHQNWCNPLLDLFTDSFMLDQEWCTQIQTIFVAPYRRNPWNYIYKRLALDFHLKRGGLRNLHLWWATTMMKWRKIDEHNRYDTSYDNGN